MSPLLLFLQIFVGDVVLLDFTRPDFAFVGVRNILHAFHDFGFEGVPCSSNSSTLSESAPAELDNPCKSPD